MSNEIMRACRPLQMRPAAKAVLMALADRADDDGKAWPSIETLCDDTCFRRSAVMEAIRALEHCLVVVANRTGRHTRYVLTPERFEGSAEQTSARRKQVRLTDRTSPLNEPQKSVEQTPEVRQTDPNPKEPKGTHKSNPHSLESLTENPGRFPDFWEAYPRKVGDKKGAQRHWSRKKLDELADQIIADVQARATLDPRWRDSQFIPHPTTYLHQERWNDDWRQSGGAPVRPSITAPISGKTFEGSTDERLDELFAGSR